MNTDSFFPIKSQSLLNQLLVFSSMVECKWRSSFVHSSITPSRRFFLIPMTVLLGSFSFISLLWSPWVNIFKKWRFSFLQPTAFSTYFYRTTIETSTIDVNLVSILSFLSFASMAAVGLMAHPQAKRKLLFLTAAKMYVVTGLIGMHNLSAEGGEYNVIRYTMDYLEYISVINLTTTEILVTEGISWWWASLILIPTGADFAKKFYAPSTTIPFTMITNYFTLMVLAGFAHFAQDVNLWATCTLYLLTQLYLDKTWQTRFAKAGAMFFAAQYFLIFQNLSIAIAPPVVNMSLPENIFSNM